MFFLPKTYSSTSLQKLPIGTYKTGCCRKVTVVERFDIQLNLKSSNTDGSFTMVNLNLFLSPYEILPIAQGNTYLEKFIMKLYVECTH